MVTKLSTALGSTPEAFKSAGIFDGFIEVDTKLYIDPHLLSNSSSPEIQEAAKYFRKYFEDIITILQSVDKTSKNALWREAVRKLTFKEIAQLGLGYASQNRQGSAIGPKLAGAITTTAHEIISAGVTNPEIFELIGLFEKNIGADRISDMTARVIIDYLLQYSQRLVVELSLLFRELEFNEVTYKIPYTKEAGYIILIPTDVLRNLPIANSWDDIDVVCQHNALLRRQVNRTIGNTWRKATTKVSKSDLRNVLVSNPPVLQDLVDQYKNKTGKPYNLVTDPKGEVIWYDAGNKYVNEFPLDLSRFGGVTDANISSIVQEICNKFKQLIEANGLSQLLYDDRRKLKNERAAQLLFFGVADCYCEANNLDLSREPNAGRGPVDFKISKGYNSRVTAELKYSSNANLQDGYDEQLPTYNIAEQSLTSYFIVIQTGDHKKKLENLLKSEKDAISRGQRVPKIIIIDGRLLPSASKLRRKITRGFSIGS